MKAKEKYKEVKIHLKQKMEWGDVKAIAEILNKKPSYISSILSPSNDSYNDQVIAEAVKIITERERNTERMLKQLGC